MKTAVITKLYLFLLFLLTNSTIIGSEYADMVVDQNGNGDYLTITQAIDALPMYPYQRTVIYIKNGIYKEKLKIDRHYITLRGEDRNSTIIRYPQLRSDWNDNRDYMGPAVVNIHGDDIVLDNLTIENSQPKIGPHAFAVYGDYTRTLIKNCNIISKGGDTVSLWNYKHGMYYLANCTLQGAVDFVCPRGWCFIRDSQFYEIRKTAALWHAGNYNPDQKFVITNSYFDGVQGFQLGRHHYEAQFYLLDCRFAETMADQPIYKCMNDDPVKNNPYHWGERKYFNHCRKEGSGYNWYQDNLDQAPGSPEPEDITPAWTFNNRWDPQSHEPLRICDYTINEKSLIVVFNEIVTVRGEPVFQNHSGKIFKIVMQRFNDINRLQFFTDTVIRDEDLSGNFILQKGDIIASTATVHERSIGSIFQITCRLLEQ